MDHLHYTTIEHRKGQHLSFAHRILIQTVSKLAGQPIASPGELVVRPTQFVTKSGVVQWPCTPVRFSATRRWKGKRPMNKTDRPVAVTMLFWKKRISFLLWSRSSSRKVGLWMPVSALRCKKVCLPESRLFAPKRCTDTPTWDCSG